MYRFLRLALTATPSFGYGTREYAFLLCKADRLSLESSNCKCLGVYDNDCRH
jgi:hypothetical protein